MVYLAWAIVVCCGIAAATYLVVTGHPWFAIIVLLTAGCASVTTTRRN
jgi:F0F1-type ATP synthase assembly protein I